MEQYTYLKENISEVTMGKQKAKIIYDEKKSKQKSALRIPLARPVQVEPDKTKYNRRQKHKRGEED